MTPTHQRIAARVAAITESATLAVDARAKALKAAGESVIGFGAGEPDFPTPPHIVEAAVEACRDPRNHRYTPAGGLPELKEAIAVKTRRDSGLAISSDQVLVTNGGKHAVYNALTTLLDPGDEVLLPAPYWTTYPEPIALAGARAVVLPTDESTGFRVTVEQLDAACTEATKALLFVSPSNPTGVVYPESEVRAIGEWALEKGIWVVTDEIYEHLTFGEHRFASMPALVPELAERCVVLNGVAKTYAMTGWRVGWMIGPTDLIAAATNFQSHVTSNVANVSQRAALAAVAGDLDAVAEMRAAFERRSRTIHRMLNEIPGVTAIEPQGAFYAFPSMRGVLGRTIAGRQPATTLDLAELILEEAKVAIVPGEAFGAPGYARLSFALSDDDLVEGVSRIGALLATAT
ncbi:pyridoxal phosphate-dependent aminotransferase [Rhabdothermincola sediminis]|uniref:pyridoxal phosphate-dependent aminotransferase n=1 Tax=Rhabdothermincola sediminis TaxID=2751370 RepID=UPI001AA06530|nr:pyridoxal phosphate-dependent aminotransferase [Rhabdothermincola sediminis]